MKRRTAIAIVLCIASAGVLDCRATPEWNLPVSLGQTREEVRRVLGPPNETIPGSLHAVSPEAAADFLRRFPGQSTEYYSSSGLVGRYDGDRLFGITVAARAGYQGWIVPSGPIVAGVRVTDDKQIVLEKLGTPTKVEDDPIQPQVNLDEPVTWPAESRYYWHRQNYTVQVDLLRQAQLIDSNKKIVAPKDTVTAVLLYK